MSDIPIWPVLEHYGWTLPRDRGTWQTIRCGVHDDKHGSARITSEGGGYVTCLGCGFKGDAIDVVKHYRPEMGFGDAKRTAQDIAGTGGEPLSGARGTGSRLPYGPGVHSRARTGVSSRRRAG